ncbi:unnamed protein product [Onchocerca flexuosa]|uniref:BAR domain-containing protein n=1 Tax=Onchocerca flexuosa TaxID=387005 RepID=A0A183H9F7_9BILA|nr:unnamed protein product [Onchocerca flexuosa]
MTTKIKVAAYRLTGGSKTVYSANYEEKISLFNNFKGQIEKLISLAVSLVTDNLATGLKQKISKDSVDSGMNKFEKVGQTLYKYSSQIEDDSSASVLQKAKEVFDKAGQKHRSFRTNILEKIQKPMKEWNETNAKHVSKELKSVNSKRDELDYAINKLRKKPDDLEVQQSVISSAMIALMEVIEDYNKNMKEIFKVVFLTSVAKNGGMLHLFRSSKFLRLCDLLFVRS